MDSFTSVIFPSLTFTMLDVKNGFVCLRLGSIIKNELGGKSQGAFKVRSSPGNNVVFWGTLTNLCLASVSCRSRASMDGGVDWTTQ